MHRFSPVNRYCPILISRDEKLTSVSLNEISTSLATPKEPLVALQFAANARFVTSEEELVTLQLAENAEDAKQKRDRAIVEECCRAIVDAIVEECCRSANEANAPAVKGATATPKKSGISGNAAKSATAAPKALNISGNVAKGANKPKGIAITRSLEESSKLFSLSSDSGRKNADKVNRLVALDVAPKDAQANEANAPAVKGATATPKKSGISGNAAKGATAAPKALNISDNAAKGANKLEEEFDWFAAFHAAEKTVAAKKAQSSGEKASDNVGITRKKKGKANQAATSGRSCVFSDEAEEAGGTSSGSGKGMDNPKWNALADRENAKIDSRLAKFFHPRANGRQEYYVEVRKLHRKYN